MALRTYSPERVKLLIALVHEVTGYNEGTSISISKEEQSFKKSKGSQGSIGRFHIPDRTYKLEITLSQTSPSNAVLNAFYSLDDATRMATFPIFLKDSSGQSLFTSPTCWVESLPEATYSDSNEDRVWTLCCANTVFGIAGNDAEQSMIEQAGQLSSLISQFGSNAGIF